MHTPLRRRLRLARRWAAYLVAVALVVLALVLGTTSQLLLPLAERHPDRIAAWLSEKAKRPVAFDRVDTQWTRRGPLLRLEGLRIGEGDGGVRVGQAEVLVSLYAGLLPGRSFTELRLRGPALTLQRGDDGRWAIRGLPTAGGARVDPLDYLEGLGELQVIGGRLDVDAPQLGLRTTIPRIDLRLSVDRQRVRAGLRGWIDAQAQPLALAVDFDRTRGDGRSYLDIDSEDLATWAPLLRHAGIAPASGSGRLQAWGELRGHRVVLVTSQFEVDDLVLAGAPLAGRERPRQAFDELRGRLRWRVDGSGWRLDAPLLRVTDAHGALSLDGLTVGGGQRFALAAARIDAAPLLAAAALADRLPDARRAWLLDAAPRLQVSDLEMAGDGDGRLRLAGHLDGMGFAAVGGAPGMDGLAGVFEGDAQGWQLVLDPDTALRFDWPHGFGVVHDVRLDGRLLGWRQGDGWQVGTPDLRIRGQGYGAHARGGLWFQNDGTRPWIDIAAELDDADVPAAKTFWLRRSMPQAAVQWLDMALEDGTVHEGRALISGDLDDWPFNDRDGLFEARGRIEGGRFRFQKDWPALEGTAAEVAFIANGFDVRGRGDLGGVPVQRFQAGIADYGDAPLQVRAEASTDAGRLLALLRRSPLHAQQAQTLDNLTASGPARATFALDLPPAAAHRPGTVSGTVDLDGAKLVEKRWNLAFDAVRGQAHYGGDGFIAPALAVAWAGQPGVLALRAGASHVQDPAQAFEAELRAPMEAADLLARAPTLDWLAPYIHGRSDWHLSLAVPQAAAPPPRLPAARGTALPPAPGAEVAGMLRLRSDLVGTALTLPAPLDKPTGEALDARVQVGLPLGEGDIDVAFGERVAVRARERNGATGVQVTLGRSSVDAQPPASGLAVSGRTGALDALEWIALAKGGNGGDDTGADALPLRQVDVQAARLRLLGGDFPQARLRLRPVPGALAVTVDGPALAGSLSVPDRSGQPIRGRFARLHWQPPAAAAPSGQGTAPAASAVPGTPTPGAIAAPATASAATAEPTTSGAPVDAATDPAVAAARAATDTFDPASIPPLQLDIDDLRYRQAELGSAQLRTRPVAGGLRVDGLQLRSDGQRADITGEWLGRGAGARTHLAAQIDSEDMGSLVSGLGNVEWLARGKGSIRLDASWPGSPAGFQLPALQGGLHIAVRDGQLLEVEPGAGRVLGLLSVAQLPRRLMLDFRDFFSRGFAFNELTGNVRFADGAARTDDMRIDGPAADIAIRGSADLRAQRFDQTIDVEPKSGNLLTVVGAVAGGPVGAAVGAAANAVLGKPLAGIGARTYHVSGPWKDPKVEVVDRDQARADGGDAPPPRPVAPVPAPVRPPDPARAQ